MERRETHPPARAPEDLARLFMVHANGGDVEGLVSLYAPDALLVTPEGEPLEGRDAIRGFYTRLLAGRPTFQEGRQRAPLRRGDVALTSSRLVDGRVTAEVALQQPDGTWLWIIDQPAIAKETR